MLGAIGWPLLIVTIWAALFLTTLGFVRWVAREKDHEVALDMDRAADQPPPKRNAPTEAEVAPPETAGQPATA